MGEEPRLGMFSIEEARQRFLELLERAAAGEEIVIGSGDGALKLTLVEPKRNAPRIPGRWKGQIHLGPEFFEDLPEEELRLWEGGDETF